MLTCLGKMGASKTREELCLSSHSVDRARTLGISLLWALGFAGMAFLVTHKKAASFDAAVIRQVQGWETPWLTPVMKFFTIIGTGVPVVAITAAILFILHRFFRNGRELLLFLFAVIGSSLLNPLLKSVFHLQRPTLHRLVEQTGYGFPSGHAMGAFSLYGITAYLFWRHIRSKKGLIVWIAVSAFLILAIGISRIYLGVHYPSDVVGGYLASGCWVFACIGIFQLES
jgi:undecaprenyl-diphosphatase